MSANPQSANPGQSGAAERADRHVLYQEAVQDTEAELDFVEQTFEELRDRPLLSIREDFCGTANTACEWVRRHHEHTAVAVDLDPEVLGWGRQHNWESLKPAQRQRATLLQDNVQTVDTDPVDAILAMNFSYYLFLSRSDLRSYFLHALQGLKQDGILFLDAYGGYEAPMEIEEPRECEGFTYIWDQATFNPINSEMDCYIHFEFPDGSRLDKAFSYHWRLWTLPEIRELLLEAGFRQVDIYWEGTDEETEEGNGIFEPTEVGDADPGWICYIVAQR